ncbi:hypothetical protein Mapa_002669 [Marchantia paleacea]|nr:hypothetical protein Mapa_002669 [Marchantia paleacea]
MVPEARAAHMHPNIAKNLFTSGEACAISFSICVQLTNVGGHASVLVVICLSMHWDPGLDSQATLAGLEEDRLP